MSRAFTAYADDFVKAQLEALAAADTSVETFRQLMRAVGHRIADLTFDIAPDVRDHPVCVLCTVEDADFLARGIVERLESNGLAHDRVSRACFWNERVRRFDDENDDSIDVAPIIKQYRELDDVRDAVLIVAKSIIRGTC